MAGLFLAQLIFDAAIIITVSYFGVKLMSLQDQITSLQADVDGLATEVTNAVADIADLKAKLAAAGVSPADLAALQAIGDKLTKATSDLKAGE